MSSRAEGRAATAPGDPAATAEYRQAEGRGATGTTDPAATAEYRRAEGRRAGEPGAPAGYRQAQGRRADEPAYREPAELRADSRRGYYGMAGTLMVLTGLLTFFIGITGIIKGVFFNHVAAYPFYFSVRSRGITLLVIGAIAVIVGLALLLYMSWARHVATVVAVVSAVANFMFLPFYPFWSIVVLTLNVLIIWELTRERGERGRREFARLPSLAASNRAGASRGASTRLASAMAWPMRWSSSPALCWPIQGMRIRRPATSPASASIAGRS